MMWSGMKTDPALLARLMELAKRPMTKAEIDEQRVSWVYGQTSHDNPLTKDEIRVILNAHNGE